MARLWSTGFELNTVSADVEITATAGNTVPTVISATKRSGTYALQTAVSSTFSSLARYSFSSSAGDGEVYARCYVYFTSNPPFQDRQLIAIRASGTISGEIRLNTDGSFALYHSASTQVGSNSSVAATGVWHLLEIHINTNGGAGADILEARLNGISFASASNLTLSTFDRLEFGHNLTSSGTFTVITDDIAVNDTSGSFQNSWPGEGSIVHLRPNAAGDNTSWSNTWQNVTDETPDDSSSIISSNTLDQISDFNIMSPDDWVFQGFSGNSAGFGEFANVRYRGMSFRASSETLDAISFQITSTGSAGMNVILTAADGSDLPTGSELANWEIANGTLSTSFTKYTLSPSYTLTKGTLYDIYLAPWNTSTHTYTDNYRDIQNKNANKYGAGKPIVMSSGVWGVSDSGNLDMYFALHGTNSVIGTSDTINVVSVGVRYNGAGASANASFVVRVKASASGTVEESSAITPSNTTYVTNANSTPRNYPLVLYDLPGASTTAWTKSDLDTAQIGVRLSSTSTNAAQVSALWMQVDYTADAAPATTSLATAFMTTNTSFWGT